MSWALISVIAVGNAINLFALAIAHGSVTLKLKMKDMTKIVLLFGLVQLGAFILGAWLIWLLRPWIGAADLQELERDIAGVIFLVLAARCAIKGIRNKDVPEHREDCIPWKKLTGISFHQCIYAFLVGVACSFSFLHLVWSALLIFAATAILIIFGYAAGRKYGYQIQRQVFFTGSGLLALAGVLLFLK